MISKNKYAGKQLGRPPSHSDPFESIRCWVPKGLMRELRRESERLGVPVERLIVRAAWYGVELEEYGPFEADLTIPSGPNPSTTENDQKLFQFLARAPRGVDLDLLIMSHEEVEMTNGHHVKWSLANLILGGLAEIFNEGDYAIPKVRAITAKRTERKERFKLFAGESVKAPQVKRTKGVL